LSQNCHRAGVEKRGGECLNKQTKTLLIFGLILTAHLNGQTPSSYISTEGWLFTISNNQATINGKVNATGQLIIPSAISNYPVVGISGGSFGYENIGISIPASVTNIESNPFRAIFSLTNITVDPDNPAFLVDQGVLYNKAKTTLHIVVPPQTASGFNVPTTVTNIGPYAFNKCSNLTSITIPEGVLGIGAFAFQDCYNLPSITIPASVTNIGDRAFGDIYRLTNITVASSNPVFSSDGGTLFNKDRTLLLRHPAYRTNKAFVIPNTVTGLAPGAFERCYRLTNITIPSGVTNIPESSFYGVVNLASLILPDGVLSIGDYAFVSCYNLKNVNIPNGVTNIGVSAFGSSGVTNLVIPHATSTIGSSAFSQCTNLTSITIGNGIKSIESSTFQGTSLKTVVIPSSVTNIGSSVFWNCLALTNVVVGSSVAYIGGTAFSNCPGLSEILFHGNAPALPLYETWFNCPANIFILPNTTGWGTTFAGRPVQQVDVVYIMNSPNKLGYFTDGQMNSNRLAGIAEVTNSPSNYNLYSSSQYSNNFTAGQQSILTSPNTYNLFHTNQIMDMKFGGMVIGRTNSQLLLTYQILQSSNLQSWSAYREETVVLSNAPPDKMFLRLNPKQ